MYDSQIVENKIIFFGYREWSFEIVKDISNIDLFYIPEDNIHSAKNILNKNSEIHIYDLKNNNIKFKNNLILYYGWSWIVDNDTVQNNICICLHPSQLPQYRGGSPIQNQIIDGNKESCVTLFKMSQGLDNGPIYKQEKISLNGNLINIFQNIINVSIPMTISLIDDFKNKNLIFTEQDEKLATYCKRRKPQDSEITINEIQHSSSEYLYNKIRSLQDPYPNAYIVCADGKKLFLQLAKLEND